MDLCEAKGHRRKKRITALSDNCRPNPARRAHRTEEEQTQCVLDERGQDLQFDTYSSSLLSQKAETKSAVGRGLASDAGQRDFAKIKRVRGAGMGGNFYRFGSVKRRVYFKLLKAS